MPFCVPRLLWFAVFLAAGVTASLIADALFSGTVIAASFAACIVLMLTLQLYHRTWATAERSLQRDLLLGAVRGLALGAIYLFCAMTSWFVGEVASGGRVPEVLLWAFRIALAGLLGVISFGLLRPNRNRYWEIVRRIAVAVVLVSLGAALVLYLILTGPADISHYPAAASSPYRLPWSTNLTRLCIQSNRGIVSHRGDEQYAYDFAMPVGSVFCAARGGTVVEVEDAHDGNGMHSPNNFICVLHGDDTVGYYAHLRQGGSLVQLGQDVKRGEPLGLSGNVGHSMLPHLHFHVEYENHTIPVSFADVPCDGVPRMFRRYTSRTERKE
jgi:hypothetical protein